MQIAIVNQSTLVTETDAAAMTAAIDAQVATDVAPVWDRAPASVTFYDSDSAVPANAYKIVITDTIADQPAGVLGYHTEAAGGILSGIIAAKPELDNGGKVTTGDWSVSSVLSHEVLEMFIDPNCNLWAFDGQKTIYSFEVCDPVEGPSYAVNGVSVSNFVTPAWFDAQAAGTSPFDKLGQIKQPFGILKTGYVVYSASGKEQQKFGDDMPEWRKEMKKGQYARTRRLLTQAQSFEH